MRQDDFHNLGVEQTIAPITKGAGLTGNATNGTGIDLAGFESAYFQISLGSIVHADTTGAVTFEESDDNSSFTAIAAAEIIGDDTVTGLVVANSSKNLKKGYIGDARYIRAVFTVTTGASTGSFPIAINVVKGHARNNPVASV